MYLKLATLDDLQESLRLTELFYEESPFSPSVRYNPKKVEDLLREAVSSNHAQVLVLLLVDDLKPRGLIVGYATETPFSNDKIASELAWYIEPAYRGSKKALDLIYAYEAWALKVGCKHVSLSLLPALTDVSKVYERLGYKQTEISYLKEL